jgi:hypothetical protein
MEKKRLSAAGRPSRQWQASFEAEAVGAASSSFWPCLVYVFSLSDLDLIESTLCSCCRPPLFHGLHDLDIFSNVMWSPPSLWLCSLISISYRNTLYLFIFFCSPIWHRLFLNVSDFKQVVTLPAKLLY